MHSSECLARTLRKSVVTSDNFRQHTHSEWNGYRVSALAAAELGFLIAIGDMHAGERPVDAEYLIQLAGLVLDAHQCVRPEDGS